MTPQSFLSGPEAAQAFERISSAAEAQGKSVYEELVRLHREQLAREHKKGDYAFAARRRAIERLGLPEVRAHRLARLEQDERSWREALEAKAEISPEMIPLLLLHVTGGRT